ncbi:hypothetical protein OG417_26050 [Actinoallomurus sp. NBC_01490]|uniref:DUF6817 domain-containing protein n=1 Tax=Actinoallomurus sp. NBC_01490 TaxID=2903557 RepID=UPI002E35208F|nr:hypothetical protein [Actinoallomurus sp. NBC_01490]
MHDRPTGPADEPEPDATGKEPRIATVVEALASRGAAEIAHPGGTLLAHLERVHALLAEWGARPALRLAGLCHAFYGTDGFATALGDPDRRDELTALVGEEAERLVHFYAGCDRRFSYPGLADPEGAFRDRFTGAALRPPLPLRRDFAELTAANELDVMRANPGLRARFGTELLDLFTSWRALLGDPAWQAVRATLA